MICKVCKRYFRPKAENKYNVMVTPTPIEALGGKRGHVYECFDCPKCGCQLVVNIREGAVPKEEAE